jgi:MGT family glycosyltransferase
VDICPPSFQTGRVPDGTRVQAVRPLFPAPPRESPPAWLGELSNRATVYVTLGTVLNDLSVFRVLLDSLADVDCNVVATIGRNNDPAALDPIPSNTRVERYVSQRFLLPRCSVVIGHGGSGSILAAFAHALPSLLTPQGADQFENAAQCVALGAGRALLPGEVTPEALRQAVSDLLTDPSYRASAQRVAAEIAAMPDPRDVTATIIAAAA